MKKLAVLISNKGTGSNLQAIIHGIEKGEINAKIVVVISDEENAYGLIRAKNHKISTAINNDKENLVPLLKQYNPDYICLAGWKQFLTDEFLKTYKNRIINLHPGLIPDTMDGIVKNPDNTNGLWNKKRFTEKALQNFFEQHATYAGSSIHFITQQVDFGPVLGRTFEKIKKTDSVESLYTRLKQKENRLYVDCLTKLCNI